MIGRLYTYFGVVGLASILAWLGLLAALVVLIVKRRQPLYYLAALGFVLAAVVLGLLTLKWFHVRLPNLATLAALPVAAALVVTARRLVPVHLVILGLGVGAVAFAHVNSRAVSRIQMDQSDIVDEMAARREKQRQRDVARLEEEAADIEFAEDAPEDVLDLGGVKVETVERLLPGQDGAAPSEGTPAEGAAEAKGAGAEDQPTYAYQAEGKKTREPSRRRTDTPPEASSLEQAKAEATVRTLPPAQHIQANRLDRANLFISRGAIWVAVLMVLVDGLRGFNRTFGGTHPVPIASRLTDALSPKARTVYLRTRDAAVVRRYLATAVRKGETFLYFGDADPFGGESVKRIAVLDRPVAWPVRPLAHNAAEPPVGPRFVFESAWFGRYSFVLIGLDLGEALLRDLVGFLQRRHRSGAAARQTVHVVWHLDVAVPAELLTELAYVGPAANFKIVLIRPDLPPRDVADSFDECLDADTGGEEPAPLVESETSA